MKNSNKQHNWYLGLVIFIIILIAGGLFFHYKWKNPGAKLIFVSGQEGGIYVQLAAEFKRLIEEHLPEIKIEHRHSAGSIENAKAIESGKAQMALIQNDIPGSSKLRAIAPIHKDYFHFLVRKDANISGFRDLAGHTIATGLEGSGSRPVVEALVEYFSLEDKTTILGMSVSEGIAAIENGEIDALLLTMGFRAPAFLNLLENSETVGLVDLRETEIEALKGFILTYPMCEMDLLPPYSYGTQPTEPQPVLTIQTILVAHEDVPPRVIKPITELLFSNRSELVQRHPAAAQMNETFSPTSVSFPLHKGAGQYFSRSEPGFLVRYAELGAFIVSLMIAGYGLFSAIRKWINQTQKDRIDEYYLQVEGYLGDLENPDEIANERVEEITKSIKEIRRTAIEQLAGEKLVPDASFRILQHLLDQCERKIAELP